MSEQKRKRGRPPLDPSLVSPRTENRRKAANIMYMFKGVDLIKDAATEIPDGSLLWHLEDRSWKLVCRNGILEQIGRMLIEDGFTDEDGIFVANLAANAVKGGYTTRDIEKAIRAVRLSYKAIDVNSPDPYLESIAHRAREELCRMGGRGDE